MKAPRRQKRTHTTIVFLFLHNTIDPVMQSEQCGNRIHNSITWSWFVVKNALIPCNGAPTGKRKSSSAL
jgi:hypothetical protein